MAGPIEKNLICGMYILLVENFFQTRKHFFFNVQEMMRLTPLTCISAHKSNSCNSCEAVNEILTELLVI